MRGYGLVNGRQQGLPSMSSIDIFAGDFDKQIARRLDILIRMDIAAFRKTLMDDGEPPCGSDDIVRIAMHMARCRLMPLPLIHRTASQKWLLKHGHGFCPIPL
jgi:hypothetical protein